MLEFLLAQPDAVALVLLLVLVGATVAVGLCAGHRRDRGGEPPEEVVTTWPHLLRLELVAALATLLVLSWWAILAEVPLGSPADPGNTPPLAKAPWFFVGVQEMLQYFDAPLAGGVLPILMMVGLCALPYLDPDPGADGRYTLRKRPVALVLTGTLIVWLLPMTVGLLLRGEHWLLQPAWRPPPLDVPLSPSRPPSLPARLGLSGATAHLLGGGLCLGPYLLLLLLLRPMRRRFPQVARMGSGRVVVAGVLLVTVLGVTAKVILVALLDIRYVWVTTWFRI